MGFQAKRAEDVLPSSVDYVRSGKREIRKGTMAAAILNAEILESIEATEGERSSAVAALQELAPDLLAFGFNQYLLWRNPDVQAIFDEQARHD